MRANHNSIQFNLIHFPRLDPIIAHIHLHHHLLVRSLVCVIRSEPARCAISCHAANYQFTLSTSRLCTLKALISVLSRSTNAQLNACYYLQKINSFHSRRVCKRTSELARAAFVACVTRCLRLSHERGTQG